MNRKTNWSKDKEKLENQIEELRDVLNEICTSTEDPEQLKKRLRVSEQMDQLIVEYMNEENKQKQLERVSSLYI